MFIFNQGKKMKNKSKSGEGSYGKMDHDYQPGEKEFAGKMMDTANDYMPRKEKQMSSDAQKIRNKSYKGRYD